jgi:hypothetical protein
MPITRKPGRIKMTQLCMYVETVGVKASCSQPPNCCSAAPSTPPANASQRGRPTSSFDVECPLSADGRPTTASSLMSTVRQRVKPRPSTRLASASPLGQAVFLARRHFSVSVACARWPELEGHCLLRGFHSRFRCISVT